MGHVHDYLEPGTELAGYRIQSLIARGGMGVVYRALDVQLGRPVALKLLAPELSANEKFRQNRKKSYRGHNNAGTAIDLAVSYDGQFLASGDTAGYIACWDWKTCKMYHKLRAGDQAVTCVAWHPQETSKFISAGMDGEIRYWD